MVAGRSYIVLLVTLITSVYSLGDFHIYHNNEFAVEACTGYLGKLVTFFNTTDKIGFCNVNNQPALGTMAECIELMPHKNARKEFLESCKKYKLTEEEYLAALQNATEFGFYDTKADKEFNKKKIFNKPILLTKKLVKAAWDSVATRRYNYNYAHWFGIALCCYWYFVVFVAAICNLTYFLFPSFVKSMKGWYCQCLQKVFHFASYV
ncbi:hypothetical protein CTRG_00268 [Candida tropicalis MYA-3404]|uniref:Uncharacterized protein n=1 Tax=Candida tropicalis (strain ATCC MYA-3404 / T1) TaxID=294747 RepID=C5M2H9_CANTT|nr:hypothetical protein CTRG_00268 [Candida tropicalis MYA-3404]EER35529.1 hypothetical protein CTRG_00268 [Candida tropicalis MYA-3404]KAG4409636.1 hypothetical protein JTP64_000274 [Candida tropicalis]